MFCAVVEIGTALMFGSALGWKASCFLTVRPHVKGRVGKELGSGTVASAPWASAVHPSPLSPS